MELKHLSTQHRCMLVAILLRMSASSVQRVLVTISTTVRCWSKPGAVIFEIDATLPTLRLRVAMSALEKAVLKVDGRLSV